MARAKSRVSEAPGKHAENLAPLDTAGRQTGKRPPHHLCQMVSKTVVVSSSSGLTLMSKEGAYWTKARVNT